MERKFLVITLAFIAIAVAKKAVRQKNKFYPETANGKIKRSKGCANLN